MRGVDVLRLKDDIEAYEKKDMDFDVDNVIDSMSNEDASKILYDVFRSDYLDYDDIYSMYPVVGAGVSGLSPTEYFSLYNFSCYKKLDGIKEFYDDFYDAYAEVLENDKIPSVDEDWIRDMLVAYDDTNFKMVDSMMYIDVDIVDSVGKMTSDEIALFDGNENEFNWKIFRGVSEKNISKNERNGLRAVRLFDEKGNVISMLVKNDYIKPAGQNSVGNDKFDIVFPKVFDTVLAKYPEDNKYEKHYLDKLLYDYQKSLTFISKYMSEQKETAVFSDTDKDLSSETVLE